MSVAENPDVIEQAKKEYPILNQYDIQYKKSIGRGQGYLEFWPPGETGAPDLPRPKEFDISKPGVEIYDPTTKPKDVAADVVSHFLVNKDPNLKSAYSNFEKTLTPQQKLVLQNQYQYAKQNRGETRPFQEWYKASGLPGFFRGYLFSQWNNPEKIYTPGQIKMFDELKTHLKNPNGMPAGRWEGDKFIPMAPDKAQKYMRKYPNSEADTGGAKVP